MYKISVKDIACSFGLSKQQSDKLFNEAKKEAFSYDKNFNLSHEGVLTMDDFWDGEIVGEYLCDFSAKMRDIC